jgi:hypothetical protein
VREAVYGGRTEPYMYTLTWTMVDALAHTSSTMRTSPTTRSPSSYVHRTQSLIVEAVEHLPPSADGGRMSSIEMPHHGMALARWIKMSLPRVISNRDDQLVVIHSIVPYAPRKRDGSLRALLHARTPDASPKFPARETRAREAHERESAHRHTHRDTGGIVKESPGW